MVRFIFGAISIAASFALTASLCAFPARGDSSPWELATPSGKITENYDQYVQRIFGLQDYQQRLDAEVEETLTNSEFTLRATPWVWLRAPDDLGGNTSAARPYFELKEGWVERASPSWDLRAGNQIFAWGAADQINPTDVWNPRDLYDLFQSTKLPIAAMDLKVHPTGLENVNLDVIFTPFFRPSQLPVTIPDSGTSPVSLSDSRWLLPFPSTVLPAGGVAAPLEYQIASASYPATWQLGARLMFLRLGGWDFSVSGFDGVETVPRFAFARQGSTSNPALPITITLNPSFHRQQMYGFDGAGSISLGSMDIGTRFEIAYYHRDNSLALSAPPAFQGDLLRDDDLWGVAGIDYTFQRKILGTILYFNLQYVYYQTVGSVEQTPGATVIQGLPDVQPWDRDLVFYLEDRIGSKLKLGGNVVGSFSNGDGFLAPMIQYGWTDNFKTTLSGMFFIGNASGFFGQFADDSRVTMNATYAF